MYRRSDQIWMDPITQYTSIFCIALGGESQQELVNRYDSAMTIAFAFVGGAMLRAALSQLTSEHSARSLLLSLSAYNKKTL
jgi:hypothetical protein